MSNVDHAAALHAALRFLVTSEVPAEHKRVLIEAVTDAIRATDREDHRRQIQERRADEWREHETSLLAAFLEGKAATSWQHADEVLMSLAAQLHRDPNDVRAKATQLGFGAGVDFKVAKADREHRAE